MTTNDKLRRAAIDRHRIRLFGDVALTVYRITPADGETVAGTFAAYWRGFRIVPTTDEVQQRETGEWQFEIWAADDWQTSEVFMKKIVALVISGRRWKVSKVEEPIGRSLVWRIRAQVQK
jgi:hypothetical protein